MADPEVLLSMTLVIITFVLYGLKWAFLIGITIYFCAVVLLPSKSREGRNVVSIKGSNDSIKCSDHSDIEYSFYTENPDTGIESSGYGTRLVRNIVRRNPTLTQELPFNNLQMYKNRQATQSSLRSPEPLLSQVTKHLSFNNTSYYYPDRTNLVLSLSDNSVSSPPSFPKWFNPADTKLPQKSSLLEKTSSFTEERYSPRQFSIVSPSRCNPHNISTVKLSRAGDNDSRFALESILHKRLERTKDNPCSRQSVLSALGQKSRKRSAYDSDSSMVESYSVKKRRRDDLDDFLDAVNSPSSAVPYSRVKPIKRSYSDSISEKPTLEITGKRIKENETRSKLSPPLSFVAGGLEDSGVDVNSPTKNLPENVLNQSAKVTQPVKPRKRKSVTFSDKLVNGSEDSSQKEPLTSEEENIKDVNTLKDSPEDYSQVFRIGFSPRKSLAPEYQASITSRIESKSSPRRHRRSNVSWKDLQENRREAWRRSQKLLDEIEESFSKEIASTSPLAVTTVSTTTVTSSLTSSLTSTITSPPASTTSFSSLQTTIDQVKTQSRTATSQSINFLNSGTEQSPFLTAGNSVASNTLFVHTARKPLSGVSSGSSGTTSGFPFASKSSTALFGGISNAPAVSLSAPSLSSANTSTKANATQSFSIQSLVGSPSTASQPTSSTLSGFRFQTSSSGVSTGSIIQTTAPVAQNTIAGPFNTGASSFNVGSKIKTPSFTTTNSSQPKIGGFSFSAPPITKENQATAPAVSVSGGFTFATEAKEEKKIPQSGFTFNASATEKSSTSGGFSFAATMNQQSSTRGGFSFAAPTTQQSGNSGGFPFAAPTTQQSSNSGGFSFVAPTTQQSSNSGGFSFVAPTTQQSSTSSGFSFAACTAEKSAGSGGFTFTAPASSKPNTSGGFSLSTASAGSSGFQFNAPAVNNNNSTFSSTTLTTNNASSGFVFSANNKPSSNSGFNFGGQSTPTTFNFGSSTPAGGFNFAGGFASSTPLPPNSSKSNNMLVKPRRPRRKR